MEECIINLNNLINEQFALCEQEEELINKCMNVIGEQDTQIDTLIQFNKQVIDDFGKVCEEYKAIIKSQKSFLDSLKDAVKNGQEAKAIEIIRRMIQKENEAQNKENT